MLVGLVCRLSTCCRALGLLSLPLLRLRRLRLHLLLLLRRLLVLINPRLAAERGDRYTAAHRAAVQTIQPVEICGEAGTVVFCEMAMDCPPIRWP